MIIVWSIGIALGSAILIGIGLIPILIAISRRLGWYAKTNHRTIHKGEIPYIGGIAIFAAFIVAIFVTNLVVPEIRVSEHIFSVDMLLFLAGFLIIHGIGLVDDFINVRAHFKLIAQFAAAALISFTGSTLTGFQIGENLIFNFGPLGHLFTILWLVGMSNAVNLIDGMDGLSGTTTSIAALFFGISFLILGTVQSAILSFALLGAVIGFLLYNWPPAKIFMGDSGALFLGFALAALPFFEHSGIVQIGHLLIPLCLLFFPLVDTFSAITRRIKRRTALSTPDKEHIHHKLLALGIRQPTILLILLGVILIPAISTVIVLTSKFTTGLAAILVAWIVSLSLVALIGKKYHRSQQSPTAKH